jgi:hypothetical protein
MEDMDLKLFEEARQRRDEARREMQALRMKLDEKEVEYQRLDDALATLEDIRREHEEFARDALSA